MSSSHDQFYISSSRGNPRGHPGMTFMELKTCTTGTVLSFHNISYRVKGKNGFLLGKKAVEKEILSNVSGIMRPGLNAILGPAGSGKSSLLSVLAARKNPEKFSGDVLINGEPYPADFKCHSGYVTQDDVMMGTLTVRENLHFSAALRLPTTMMDHEKNKKINEVIEELGLDKVADSKVGNERIHGVSRAERKKTSIAMELVTDPSILFLDEPTNALDSSTAHAVLLLLKRMSKQGRMIIFSIRDPRYSIFKMFDSLTLLAAGKLMFHGPAQMAVEHFTSAGYNCGPYNNPADFFLDVISGVFTAVESDREEEDNECGKTEEFSMTNEPLIKKLAGFCANSSLYRDTKAELDQLLDGQNKRSSAFKKFAYSTSIYHQLRWISWRSLKNFLGDRQMCITEIIITTIAGLLMGVFFLGLKNDCAEIQSRVWMFYVVTISPCVFQFSARHLFLGEKKLFMHEYMNGYYRELSYFLGKLLCDLVPRRLLQIFISTCILYIMVGLKPAVEAFFIMILTLLMVAFSVDSVTLTITVGQKMLLPILTLLVNSYFQFMMRFWLMTVVFQSNEFQLSWLPYISIPYYGLMALQHNEFWGQNFCTGLNETGSSSCPNYVICSGEEFLTMAGIDLSAWGLWKNHVVLALVTIIFFIMAFLKLLFFKKHF
ncbi:broad substrate specificity ATP-binding cassette transporter ABCG2-like [Cavia porcellus]|uniref:broad substrate specificity ATP-binding cassette transporter ABCG2-like n=1 Tax=Cavia porcellus TaxID=10141 RepID=UPI000C8793E5|nr:ATP-binding cassette sub-family G member 2-like [Cavia porcellus]